MQHGYAVTIVTAMQFVSYVNIVLLNGGSLMNLFVPQVGKTETLLVKVFFILFFATYITSSGVYLLEHGNMFPSRFMIVQVVSKKIFSSGSLLWFKWTRFLRTIQRWIFEIIWLNCQYFCTKLINSSGRGPFVQ